MSRQAHHDSGGRAWRAIVLIGPPGVGKGTQGRALGQVPGYVLVSMGEVLRAVDPDRPLGREVRQHLERGSLVPDETAIAVWREHVEGLGEAFDPERDRLVLDGIPRDDEQVRLLEPHVAIEAVVHLDCPDEDVLLGRIRQRREGRVDDRKDAVIRHRFEIYRERTAPVLRLLPPEVVHAVDGSQSPMAVLHDVTGALGALR